MRRSWLAITCVVLAFALCSCKETGGGTLSGDGNGPGGVLDTTGGTDRLTEVNNPPDDEFAQPKAYTFYSGQVTIWYPGKDWTVEGDDDDVIFSSEGEQIVASVSERTAPKDPVDDATFIQGVYAGIPLEAATAEGFDQAWKAIVPDGDILRFYFVATKRIAENISVTLQMTGHLVNDSVFLKAFKANGWFQTIMSCFIAFNNGLHPAECQFLEKTGTQTQDPGIATELIENKVGNISQMAP